MAASPSVVLDISEHQTSLRRLSLAVQLLLFLQRRASWTSQYRAGLRPATKRGTAVVCLPSVLLAELLAGSLDPFSLTKRYGIVKDRLLELAGLNKAKLGNHRISMPLKVPSSECRAIPPLGLSS